MSSEQRAWCLPACQLAVEAWESTLNHYTHWTQCTIHSHHKRRQSSPKSSNISGKITNTFCHVRNNAKLTKWKWKQKERANDQHNRKKDTFKRKKEWISVYYMKRLMRGCRECRVMWLVVCQPSVLFFFGLCFFFIFPWNTLFFSSTVHPLTVIQRVRITDAFNHHKALICLPHYAQTYVSSVSFSSRSFVFVNSDHLCLPFFALFCLTPCCSIRLCITKFMFCCCWFWWLFFLYRQIIQMENSPPPKFMSCCCCCYHHHHHHHRLASSHNRCALCIVKSSSIQYNMHSENGKWWIVCWMLGLCILLKTCGWWFCNVWLNVRSENHQLQYHAIITPNGY